MPSIRIGPESLSIRRLAARADVPINGDVYIRVEPVGELTVGVAGLECASTFPSVIVLDSVVVLLVVLFSSVMFVQKNRCEISCRLFSVFFFSFFVNTVDRTIMMDDKRSSESS